MPQRGDATGCPRPQRYADDLAALLDHLGVARAAIVARSMGGWTARLYVAIDELSGRWSRAAARQILDAMRVRAVDELQGITCSVLAVVGEEDVVCPPDNARMASDGLPLAQVSIVRDAGHSVYFERAATFDELVQAFLAGPDQCSW